MKKSRISNIFASLAMTSVVVASVIQPAAANVATVDPTPANPPTVTTIPDIAKDPQALKELIGKQGARMGQGMTRIKDNKTPQTPTSDAPAPTPVKSSTSSSTAPVSSQSSTPISISLASTESMVPQALPAGVQGLDVSGWQSNVDWVAQRNMGARFAYVKATEGTTFTNSSFGSQYNGSYNAGLIRGAYHFAIPSVSSGATQADFFVNNGGGWSADGKTMPPLLDIEYNPYSSLGNICYNMSATDMVRWISDFSARMKARTGRVPAIYSTTDWWKTCTGNSASFSENPLHIASYSSVVGSLPASWQFYSIWQYSSTGPFDGDSNVWNGTESSLTAFAANAPTTSAPAPAPAPVTSSAIAQKAASLNGGLGSATTGEIYGLKNGGGYQCFQLGCIIWSPATGAHVSRGAIRDLWAKTGFENGGLGYPTTDEIGGLKDGGVYQNYQGGAILYSPATGAHLSVGATRTAWAATGFENGPLGYPTTDEIGGLKNGGVYQNYQGGAIIWSPASGAHISVGAIRNAWASQGFETGPLGYPTSDVITGLKDGGSYQMYQGGAILYSPASGAHISIGAIRDMWAQTGFEGGQLGYPTSDVVSGLKDGGAYQNYQHGAIMWSPATGAHVSVGAIRGEWAATGFENGRMGYPTSNEVGGLKDGGVYQMYQGGAILYSPASGAHISVGGIRSTWASTGFESGRLGYPTSDEYSTGNGNVAQDYQGGKISWSPASGSTISYK